MTMQVCALLLPPARHAQAVIEITAQLRACAVRLRPEWQSLSDIEILEQVLRAAQHRQVREAINKESTTTQVG
jgi:hypothetical protein